MRAPCAKAHPTAGAPRGISLPRERSGFLLVPHRSPRPPSCLPYRWHRTRSPASPRGARNRQDVRVSSKAQALNLAGKALTPGAQRSWWLREALAAENDARPLPSPPLQGDVKADLVIVGGGFTGLWTAYHLNQSN